MQEYLEEMWDAPGEAQASWLRGRLLGESYENVLALRAALAGYCIEGCDQEFAVATAALNDIVDERHQAKEIRTQAVLTLAVILTTIATSLVIHWGGDLFGRRRAGSNTRQQTNWTRIQSGKRRKRERVRTKDH
jgi:hypothetical protein